jgi:hypothetical protein
VTEQETREIPVQEAEPEQQQPEPLTPSSGSMMDQLRRKRHELEGRKTVDIDVPGYDGMLVAEYRIIGTKELEQIGTKIEREFKAQGDRMLFAAIDGLLKACVQLYYSRDGDKVPISESFGPDEPPVTFDSRLAEFFNLNTESARDTLYAVFAENEIAIMQHSEKLGRWLGDTSREVQRVFLGER